MKKLLTLFFLLLSSPSFATTIDKNSLLDKFITNLKEKNVKFTQTKTISSINKNFTTTGKIKFIKNVGFIFTQETPTTLTFTSTMDKYCTNGQSNTLNNLPYFSQIKSAIDDLLNNNYKKLNEIFNIDYTETTTNWTLFLTPKNSRINEFIKVIQITGNQTDLDEIITTYKNNMEINLKFSNSNGNIKDEIKC